MLKLSIITSGVELQEVQMARTPIHPGETLREDIQALGMSAAELARQIKVPVNRITEIINAQRGVTGDTALRLARFFGTSAEFWLNLQKLYELRIAEQKKGKEIARLPVLNRVKMAELGQ
jgi:antitoxin HigA-1